MMTFRRLEKRGARARCGWQAPAAWVLVSSLVGGSVLAPSNPGWAQSEPSNERLVIGVSQEFESMNPIIATMVASVYTYYMVGRSLTYINQDWEWVCGLCTKLPSIENGLARVVEENGKKTLYVDWELKPNLKWGDGRPLTAKDLRLMWEIGGSDKVSSGDKTVYTRVSDFIIDKDNPRRFTTKFKEVRYDFYQKLEWRPIPAHIEGPIWEKAKDAVGAYEQKTAYTTDPTNKGLYSGPYLVKELALGSHLVLERNPHFFGSPAKIKQITLKLVPNTQTLTPNLESGTIHMISELGLTFDQALAFEKKLASRPDLAKRFEVRMRDGLTYEHIDLNLRNPMLQDVRVRRALLYAIDRDKLTTALFEGRQKPALSNIHPLDPYYTADVPKYPHDPDKAAQLLDEAGWKLKGKYRFKDDKKLKFTIMTTAGNKTRELAQVFLQNEWKKVGIDIDIKNEPARVFFGETTRKAKFPAMAMYAWISSPDNPPLTTLHSEQIPTQANGWSGQNYPGWKSAKVDKLLDAIYLEFDFDKRKKMMAELQREYTREVPVLPLYLRANIAVIPANLKNFKLTGHQAYNTNQVEHWTLEPSKTPAH